MTKEWHYKNLDITETGKTQMNEKLDEITDKRKIFVGGLSHKTTNESLNKFFKKYGSVLHAEVMRDADTMASRKFGFVVFADENTAKDVLHKGKNHAFQIDSKEVEVKLAQPKNVLKPTSSFRSEGGSRSFMDSMENLTIETRASSYTAAGRKTLDEIVGSEYDRVLGTNPFLTPREHSGRNMGYNDQNLRRSNSMSCQPRQYNIRTPEHYGERFGLTEVNESRRLENGMFYNGGFSTPLLHQPPPGFANEEAASNSSSPLGELPKSPMKVNRGRGSFHTDYEARVEPSNFGRRTSLPSFSTPVHIKQPTGFLGYSSSGLEPELEDDFFVPNKIFVGGLLYATGHESLKQYFGKFGEVTQAEVIYNRETKKSRGFGFVIFKDPEVIKRLLELQQTQKLMVDQKEVEIKLCKAREDMIQNSTPSRSPPTSILENNIQPLTPMYSNERRFSAGPQNLSTPMRISSFPRSSTYPDRVFHSPAEHYESPRINPSHFDYGSQTRVSRNEYFESGQSQFHENFSFLNNDLDRYQKPSDNFGLIGEGIASHEYEQYERGFEPLFAEYEDRRF